MFSCFTSCCWRNNNPMIPLTEESQNSPSDQEMSQNQEAHDKSMESIPSYFLAEWIVNPGILIQHLTEVSQPPILIPEIINIVAEYLHYPDPNAKYVFGPEQWIKEYKDPKSIPPNFINSIFIDAIQFNEHREIGNMVIEYLDNDMIKYFDSVVTVSESTFFTGNEEHDKKLKNTMPSLHSERLLQSPDYYSTPGKKIEELALRLFLPTHLYGKQLSASEYEEFISNIIYKTQMPAEIYMPLQIKIRDEGGYKTQNEARWLITPMAKINYRDLTADRAALDNTNIPRRLSLTLRQRVINYFKS